MTDMQKLIVVSNRLPVSVSKEKGKLVFKPSAGGLATAMSTMKGSGKSQVWIGWPGISSDELNAADKKAITTELKQYDCAPVFLTENQVKKFYEGYSNETLWPLFHYFKTFAQFDEDNWQAYKEVNQAFRDAVLEHAEENVKIWVHDYHLMLLPNELRKVLPGSSIGFFLHIPFPSFEVFRLLPQRKEILEGLLGSDLVGFHVYDYVRHFTSSVLRTLGHEQHDGAIRFGERAVRADAFPIGIDYKKFVDATKSKEVAGEIRKLNEHYKNQRIILSVDRLDYSKGIAQRLEAFEKFLQENPDYHKKVVLVVVAVPSRTEVNAYKQLRDVIEQMVSRINGTFATIDWTPISYQFQNLPFTELVALYAKSDVALVTPLRDGMNLVAKEYVASQQSQCGVLILSELTGAVDELPEALVINPNDTAGVVAAIERALVMPVEERQTRIEAMQRRISRYTVRRWAQDFMDQLDKTKRTNKSDKQLNADAIVSAFQEASRRAILLDYDGTLAPFVDSPNSNQAAPSDSLLRMLTAISAQLQTDVSIISGRPRDILERWFGGIRVNLVAEHGFWVKHNGDWAQADVPAIKYKQKILSLLEQYTERTPGSRIEEKSSAVVWHYRRVTPELAYARKTSLRHELQELLRDSEIEIHNGHKIIEIKPRGIDKGYAASELLAGKNYDFILSAGDDYTDEDMFGVLPETAFTVKVGQGNTEARYQVYSVDTILYLLHTLALSSGAEALGA
jgi:trehalose 6-phosphate synthase/phosphatase